MSAALPSGGAAFPRAPVFLKEWARFGLASHAKLAQPRRSPDPRVKRAALTATQTHRLRGASEWFAAVAAKL
jgi:hypothetical protein